MVRVNRFSFVRRPSAIIVALIYCSNVVFERLKITTFYDIIIIIPNYNCNNTNSWKIRLESSDFGRLLIKSSSWLIIDYFVCRRVVEITPRFRFDNRDIPVPPCVYSLGVIKPQDSKEQFRKNSYRFSF